MFAQLFKPKISVTDDFKERVLADVKGRVALADPLKAIVFGSYAEGRAHTDSDIDVLIVCRDAKDLRRVRNAVYAKLCAPITEVPVDFIFVIKDDFERRSLLGGICMVANEKGFLLYETKK